MSDERRVKRMYVLTEEVERKLIKLAQLDRRNRSAQIRVLIDEAYERRMGTANAMPPAED